MPLIKPLPVGAARGDVQGCHEERRHARGHGVVPQLGQDRVARCVLDHGHRGRLLQAQRRGHGLQGAPHGSP
eukprot:9235365-Alexandrium_andersonii.AAC.1